MDVIEKTISAIIAALLTMILYGSFKRESDWDSFKSAHACRKVAVSTKRSVSGYNPNGDFIYSSAGSTSGWLCDNGVTYTR